MKKPLCPRCIEDWTDDDGVEQKGEKMLSHCEDCGVCKDCEHLAECVENEQNEMNTRPLAD